MSMFLPQNYALLCTESTAYLSRSLSLTDAQLTYALMLLALDDFISNIV